MDRCTRGPKKRAEKKGRSHEGFTGRLGEVMETLQPEFLRWYPHLAASLSGVEGEIFELYMEVLLEEWW